MRIQQPEGSTVQAHNYVLGKYYNEFWRMLDKGDYKKANHAAEVLVELGVTSRRLRESGKRRDKREKKSAKRLKL